MVLGVRTLTGFTAGHVKGSRNLNSTSSSYGDNLTASTTTPATSCPAERHPLPGGYRGHEAAIRRRGRFAARTAADVSSAS